MALSSTAQRISGGVDREASGWTVDPLEHFGHSLTAMHSVPRDDLEAVQLAALRMRLEGRREEIPVLGKLADAEGIHGLNTLDDAIPLFFEHNVYKSYPISLLSKGRFDLLTKWLNRLTPIDLSGMDTGKCDSIDRWLEELRVQKSLEVVTSSGTSGTMSFVPKTRRDFLTCIGNQRISAFQTFGTAPTAEDIGGKVHMVLPSFRSGNSTAGRFSHYFREVVAGGDDLYHHTAYDEEISADLLWLAGRLRAAAAKGDMSRLDVPKYLLDRRGELERVQREMPAQQAKFIETITRDLQGKRVYAAGIWNMFYDVAIRSRGGTGQALFSTDSVLQTGGGAKGMVPPEDWKEVIAEFFGTRIVMSYGMTEINGFSLQCSHVRYHVPPWVILYLLDPETSRPLPRTGVRTGRAAYFDISMQGAWGGLITGDRVTADWDTPCPCGRTSIHLAMDVERYSALQGGNDKITCAATPGAHAEAMDYLVGLDA
jgi:hypothetical protein